MHGGLFPGMLFIAKGFNPDIGWGVTTTSPIWLIFTGWS